MKNINVIIGALIISLSSCGKKDNTAAMSGQGATPYPVVSVPTQVVTSYDAYPTNIEGIVNNAVRAKIQGYITEVYVDEGQYVKAGQPLFKLETNVLTQTADAAKSGIGAAQANVNAAQVEVNKLIPLVEKKIISNVQLETAKASLAQAKATLSQAQSNYRGAIASVDYAIVRSPVNGTVGSLNFRQGALVGPSDQTPITTISDTSSVYAYFSMNEKEYLDFISRAEGTTVKEKLAKIPPVELVLPNGETYPQKGRIQTVSGQINPNTGSMDFRAVFSNASKVLANGNSGTIKVPKTYVDALVVPSMSTFEQQGISYVYKVVKDTVRATPITVLDQTGNLTVVKSGVNKGDVIIAQGVGKVRDKSAVKPIRSNFDSIVNSVKAVF